MRILGVQVPFTKRAKSPELDDRYFTPSIFSFFGSDTVITPETAITFTAVYGCVKIISETLASMPLLLYKRLPDGGKERAEKNPLYRLLRSKPNNLKTTSMELREMLTAHVLLWGNGYAQILKNRMGEAVEIHPLHPSRVTPKLVERQVVYEVQASNGEKVILPGDEVFHLRGYRDSGLMGLSPIAAAKRAIEQGVALESYGTNFFQNGAFPSGVLEFDQGALTKEAKDNLRDSWQDMYGGQNKGKKVAVLEAGLKWKPMGIPQGDAQFLEQRRFQIEEISRIYRVPPHMLADLSRSTYSNIEAQGQEFLTYCLLPWLVRWEQAITRDFLEGDDSEYFAEFLIDGLLRGDTLARNQSYAIGRQWGYLSANDVRKRENLNPIGPEGDIYLSPMNMTSAGNETQPADPQAKDPQTQDPPPKDQAKKSVRSAFHGPLKEAWGRVVRKEAGAVKTAAKKVTDESFPSWKERFTNEQRAFVTDCLSAIVEGYTQLNDLEENPLPKLAERYWKEAEERVDAWRANPEAGYTMEETVIIDKWTTETLEYGSKA